MERIDLGGSLVFRDERHGIVFAGSDASSHFRALAKLVENFGPEAPAFGMVVVSEDAPPPSPEMRHEGSTAIGNALNALAAMAVVIEGGGIVATTKRTMARVMVSVSRSRTPFRVFKETEPASEWLGEVASSMGVNVFGEQELPKHERVA